MLSVESQTRETIDQYAPMKCCNYPLGDASDNVKDDPDYLLEILVKMINTKDINAQDEQGNTALHIASQYKRWERHVKALLDLGANPNIQNKDGNTPLHIVYNSEATAKMLIDHGADLTLVNCDGDTPVERPSVPILDFIKTYSK